MHLRRSPISHQTPPLPLGAPGGSRRRLLSPQGSGRSRSNDKRAGGSWRFGLAHHGRQPMGPPRETDPCPPAPRSWPLPLLRRRSGPGKPALPTKRGGGSFLPPLSHFQGAPTTLFLVFQESRLEEELKRQPRSLRKHARHLRTLPNMGRRSIIERKDQGA